MVRADAMALKRKAIVAKSRIKLNALAEEYLLPHIHTIVSLLKRWLLGAHHGRVEEKHLQAYLDEYVFRFKRRKFAQRGLIFYRLLESALQTKPTTYNDLVSH